MGGRQYMLPRPTMPFRAFTSARIRSTCSRLCPEASATSWEEEKASRRLRCWRAIHRRTAPPDTRHPGIPLHALKPACSMKSGVVGRSSFGMSVTASASSAGAPAVCRLQVALGVFFRWLPLQSGGSHFLHQAQVSPERLTLRTNPDCAFQGFQCAGLITGR